MTKAKIKNNTFKKYFKMNKMFSIISLISTIQLKKALILMFCKIINNKFSAILKVKMKKYF
jgi:hypothetical protein